MSNVVNELLTLVGERVVRGEVPAVERSYDPETKQMIFAIPGDPRKLVLDLDGSIQWFNAETGPVGV